METAICVSTPRIVELLLQYVCFVPKIAGLAPEIVDLGSSESETSTGLRLETFLQLQSTAPGGHRVTP